MICYLRKNTQITVSELFSAWIFSRKNAVKKSTYVNYNNLYKNYILPYLGDKQVNEINAFVLNRFSDDLLSNGGRDNQGLATLTVQAVMIILRSVLSYGEEEYGISVHSKNIIVPKASISKISVFSDYEISKIIEAAKNGDSFKKSILLSLYTGIRIGELCALTFDDIDISQGLIHIRKTLYRIYDSNSLGSKTTIIIDTPKSKSSVRDIPIPEAIFQIISELKSKQQDIDYFLTCSTNYTEPRSYSSRYKTFLKNLNIQYRKFHSLRHTFATQCIKSGVDVKTLSEILGHSSVYTAPTATAARNICHTLPLTAHGHCPAKTEPA